MLSAACANTASFEQSVVKDILNYQLNSMQESMAFGGVQLGRVVLGTASFADAAHVVPRGRSAVLEALAARKHACGRW